MHKTRRRSSSRSQHAIATRPVLIDLEPAGSVYQQGGGVHYEGPGGQAVLGNGLQWAYVTPAAAPIAD